MDLLDTLKNRATYMAVVGLGYVGLPLAVAFSRYYKTIGFDVNNHKINQYRKGIDSTGEVGNEAICHSSIEFTDDAERLQAASFIIIAVPTPINGDKTPDLAPVKSACTLVGHHLGPQSIVVFESTVYPGVTEDICRPLLEDASGLICGQDFKIGYSPERINPGDKVHRLHNIVKIVSGIDQETLHTIAAVYDTIIDAGIYLAPSIKVAEAAKLVENSQRDINIAFMNELAMVFDRIGIETNEVLKAMNTKWNSLGFKPGLVGGHCIGIDPYYFIYQAELLGYHSQIIAAGRRVNDGMSDFIAQAIIKTMIKAKRDICRSTIVLFGMTFKENCPDTRNSRAVDVYERLKKIGLEPMAVDPVADKSEFQEEYGIQLFDLKAVEHADCLVFLVAHREFCNLSEDDLVRLCGPASPVSDKVIIDVKSIFSALALRQKGFAYWSL